jgi:hypothetical protein
MKPSWCPYCGSRHAPRRFDCAHTILATEPERQGWRVTVETPRGVEAYGVLVAPCEDGFRARILTYPNVLWTIPGGNVTMKFFGETPREAEESAIAFIEAHIARKGVSRRDALDPVQAGPFPQEDRARGRTATARRLRAPRKVRTIPLRFGPTKPQWRAVTGNVSETGMFVVTDSPLDRGSLVAIEMETEARCIEVSGTVLWSRHKPEIGRLAGMGIRLEAPPTLYTQYVRQIP